MDLNLLRQFVQVADSKGFSAAASELGTNRSSVSRAVAALEKELQVQLFHRSTRRVSLTSAGEALYRKVAGQLRLLVDALETLPERREEPSGSLRVTVSHDLGFRVFPHAIAGFIRRYPNVQVDVRVTNRRVDLVGEGFDAALRPGPKRLPDSSMRARPLSAVTGGCFASPAYLAQAGTPRSLKEAARHRWVLGPGHGLLPFAASLSAPLVGDDMLFVRAALVEHLGIGILPSFVVGDDLVAGRLVQLPLREIQENFFLYLLTPAAEHISPKLRAFRDYLVEYFKVQPLASSPS